MRVASLPAVLRALAGTLLVVGSVFLPIHDSVQAGRIEAGSFTAHDTTPGGGQTTDPVTINFRQTFDVAPIVVAIANQAGQEAATIRITNVTTTGFDELIIEPDGFDGVHVPMDVHYIAVEPGRHVLPDGSVIEAGWVGTSATTLTTTGSMSWASISFSAPFVAAPSVVAQIQTANSETGNPAATASHPFMTAVVRSVNSIGFETSLDRSQTIALGGFVTLETIGWIAFPSGVNGSFPATDLGGQNVNWSARRAPVNTGWDDGCSTNATGLNSTNQIVAATKNTRADNDGGWFRRCNISSTSVGLAVDEDTAVDSERSHTVQETASIIAFSEPFHTLLEPDISVTKTSVSFTDGHGSGFALPNATVEFLITVQNSGNAPPNHDSVVVTESIPPDMALVVSDFGGAGSGPIEFQDGTPGSGMSCNFSGLGSAADCYAFSTDGVNFNYIPSDSGDGTDPAVTHVRATPNGYMAPDVGNGPASFHLRFKAKIK